VTVPRTVVIAEDEAIVRLDLAELLAEEGFDVVGQTARGDEAVELARELQPDLVVLDIKMPGMDGLKAAAEINQSIDTAVLVLTALNERALIEEARDAGAVGYLVKPFRKEELLPAIEVAMGRVAETRALDREFASFEDGGDDARKLETRRIIDRAKARLMDDHSMREPEAFAFIETTASERGVSLTEVARSIESGEIVPGRS
jgi:two-component system, response regulator PdtaR